ncbi:MAG: hypothetical protein GXP25_05385 [Planctomycetes bacterium]|nr:hypothetical protein [Planctomycetota bacterium]
MRSGYRTQLTRQIGEHLVVAKLGRLGILATPFAGNVPDYDLVACDTAGHSLPIQVKAINGPSWQFSATSFLKIEFQGNRQVVKGKAELTNPGLICVFVFLKPDEQDEFYIFRKRFLQNHFLKRYKGGIRPRNPKSIHCAIWPKELKRYRDNWKLITKYFAPVT